MNKILLIMPLLLISTAFAINKVGCFPSYVTAWDKYPSFGTSSSCGSLDAYYDKCPTDSGTSCNNLGVKDADPVLFIVCPNDWGLSTSGFTTPSGLSTDMCNKNDGCDGGYLSKTLCTYSSFNSGSYCSCSGSTCDGICPGTFYGTSGVSFDSCNFNAAYNLIGCAVQKFVTSEDNHNCIIYAKTCTERDFDDSKKEVSVHCFYFKQTFSKRDEDVLVGSLGELTCSSTPLANGFTKLVTTTAPSTLITTSGWCDSSKTFLGLKGGKAYCFKVGSCSSTNGFQNGVMASNDCLCADQDSCLTRASCLGIDKNHCYSGFACSGSTTLSWGYTKLSTLLTSDYSKVRTFSGLNFCSFNPTCFQTGDWGYQTNSRTVRFSTTLEKDCSSMIGNGLTSLGNMCGAQGFFYDLAPQVAKCYFGLDCTSCNTVYPAGNSAIYCGSQQYGSFAGGFVGKVVDCPTPGFVDSSTYPPKCYYSRSFDPNDPDYDFCNSYGCSVRYGLLLSDNYECNATVGPKLKLGEKTPPRIVLQTIPSIMVFGLQDVAELIAEGASDVKSCSCYAQDIVGRDPFCYQETPAGREVKGYYPVFDGPTYFMGRSTIYKSSVAPYTYDSSYPYDPISVQGINIINCTCKLSDNKLIEGIRWSPDFVSSYYPKQALDNVCVRLFGGPNCYWNYTASTPLSDWHGADLSTADSWCISKPAFNGYPCDYYTNKVFRFKFDVETLIDLKINIYDPTKSSPLFVTSFTNGEVIKTGDSTPESLAKLAIGDSVYFDFKINGDIKILGYDQASINLFCTSDYPVSYLDVIINGALIDSISCNQFNPWQSLRVPIEYLGKTNNVELLSSGPGNVFLGVDTNSKSTWSLSDCNTSPISEEVSIADDYFISNGLLIGYLSDDNASEFDLQGRVFNIIDSVYGFYSDEPSDVEYVNDFIYPLIGTDLYKTPVSINPKRWQSLSTPLLSDVKLIASAYNQLFVYKTGVINEELGLLGGIVYSLDDNASPVNIEGLFWLNGSPNGLFAGNKDGVYYVRRSLEETDQLAAIKLPGSAPASFFPYAINDWDGDGDTDFIGVNKAYFRVKNELFTYGCYFDGSVSCANNIQCSLLSDGSVECDGGYSGSLRDSFMFDVSVWNHGIFNSFTSSKLLYSIDPFSELVAGDFSMNGGAELLFNTSPVSLHYNGNLISKELRGSKWSVLNDYLYSLDGDSLIRSGFLNLTCVDNNSPIYSFIIQEGEEFSSLDLLFPNINVDSPSDNFKFFDDVLDRDLILGTTLICDSDIIISFNLKSEEVNVNYSSTNIEIRFNGVPIDCGPVPADKRDGVCNLDCPEGDECIYCDGTSVPIIDSFGRVAVQCHLPPCSYGFPEVERFQVCVNAGTFEYDNCNALNIVQPLAGDPTGITGTPAISGGVISVSLNDANGLYDSVSGLKIRNSAGISLCEYRDNIIVDGDSYELFDYIQCPLTSGTYSVWVYVSDYYETQIGTLIV